MSNQNAIPEVPVLTKLEMLDPKAKLAEVIDQLNKISSKVNNIKVRDRGPKSSRSMTDEDAKRCKFGDLKDLNHKEAAKELGLSYGQIYSARCGYTFQHVKKEG